MVSPHGRVERVFEDRDRSVLTRSRYSFFHPAHLLSVQERERRLLDMLGHQGFGPDRINSARVLSVGCGSGLELLDLVRWGAAAPRCVGVELSPDRARMARDRGLPVSCGDAVALPLADESFDLVLQFTLMTSVLDPSERRAIAAGMLRVLRPDGLIVWYDFWPDNPGNPDVRGIRRPEIRSLFPGCRFTLRPCPRRWRGASRPGPGPSPTS